MSTQQPTPLQNEQDNENDVFGTPVGSPVGILAPGHSVNAVQDVASGSSSDEMVDALEDDGLPSYLVRTVGRGEGLNMVDVREDIQEEGFGDSDNEADDLLEHDTAMEEAMAERRELAGVEEEETVEFNDRNAILLQKGAAGPAIKLPGPPTNWSVPARKEAKGEPIFSLVDNPGGWHEFTYRPEFSTKGEKNI